MKETLLLTRNDIRNLLTVHDVVDAVEDAFRQKGLKRVQMPPKVYIFFEKVGGDFRVMPAYIEKLNMASVKIVNSHPKNPSEKGLPTVMAVIELIDPDTGFPLAIMDGTYITAMRTMAASIVAIKYLAKKDFSVIGLVGAGVQGQTQAKSILEYFNGQIEKFKIYDIISEKAERLCRELSEKFSNVSIEAVDSARKAVENSDIVITLTPSRKPYVKYDWVSSGTHFNCMGADAPGKQEVDPKILLNAKIIVDDREQAIHSGEINVPISKGILKPDDIYAELGEIIAGLKPGRENDEELTVFVSTGLAIQDTATAYIAYKKAIEQNIGRKINLLSL